MSKRIPLNQSKFLNQHRYILRKLSKLDNDKRKKILKSAPSQLFKALDIVFSLIAQNKIPLTKKHESVLKKHQRFIKNTTDLKHSAIKRKAQSGGAFGAILSALIPIIGSVLSKIL